MRLLCDVDIGNRCLPSYNMKGTGRTTRAYLSVGQKPGSTNKQRTVYIMLCSAKDKNGTKYLVKDNIQKVFCNFVNEGKATIRLKEPEIDICISKADSIHLKSFLSVLRASLKGECPAQKSALSVLVPLKPRQLENTKTKLAILKRQDYPVFKGFPISLTNLKISGCHLKKVESRLIELKFLQCLDLSDNALQALPDAFCNLKILELILRGNQFADFPTILLKAPIAQHLSHLDFSNNRLTRLPEDTDRLMQMLTLKVSGNKLTRLPAYIGNLCHLQNLVVSSNQIPLLPHSFIKLRLNKLDLAHNSFSSTPSRILRQHLKVVNLQDICAKSIVKNRIPYNKEVLFKHLIEFIEYHKLCWCGQFVFETYTHCVYRASLSFIAASLLTDDTERLLPIEAYFCSQKCFDRFSRKQFSRTQ